MKKLLILIILIAMAGGAGFIFWKRQAKLIEAQIATTLTAFNDEVKAQTGVVPVEYDRIEISGFPFAITLTMHNPTLRLPLSQWAETQHTGITWVEEHRFQGDITLSADWKVTHYTLRLPKTRESVSIVNGKPAFARKASTEYPMECEVSLNLAEAMDNLWQPMRMLTLAKDNLALIKHAECAVQGYQLVSAQNPQIPFQRLQNLEFEADFYREDNQQIQAQLLLKLEKFHAHPASDQYYKALLTALPSLAARVQNEYIVPHSLALFGEQSIELQGDYIGDFTLPTWGSTATLNLPQFTLQNALFSAKGKAKISNQPSESARQIAFEMEAQASFTPAAEKLAANILAHRWYYQPAAIGISGFHVSTAYLPPNQLGNFAADIFPKISTLNPLQIAASGVAQVIPATQFDVALKQFAIKHRDWNLTLSGNGSYAPARLLPTGKAILKIEKGDEFYAQFIHKLVQLEQWRQLQRPAPVMLITQDFLNDFKRFVDSVAQGKRQNLSAEIKTLGDLTFQISLENFLPQINGLGINEIILLYNDLLMQHFGNNATPTQSQQQQGYQPATGG